MKANGLQLGEFRSKFRRARNTHLPRYIFIHINKTAGSSIERALHLRFEHKTAIEKRAELGAVRWRSAYKFTFVRNPWDKVASHYRYRVLTDQTSMGDGHIGFRDWVLRAYRDHDPKYYDQPKMFMPQTSWICDADGRVLVDYIGRFENLQADFTTLTKALGIAARLPHLKPTQVVTYHHLYDRETASIVSEVFASDITHFGYSFE